MPVEQTQLRPPAPPPAPPVQFRPPADPTVYGAPPSAYPPAFQQPASAPQGKRRPVWLIPLVALVGLLLVSGIAVGAIVAVSGRSSDNDTSGPGGADAAARGNGANNVVAPPADFSGAPRTTWQVRPSDFYPDADSLRPAGADLQQ